MSTLRFVISHNQYSGGQHNSNAEDFKQVDLFPQHGNGKQDTEDRHYIHANRSGRHIQMRQRLKEQQHRRATHEESEKGKGQPTGFACGSRTPPSESELAGGDLPVLAVFAGVAVDHGPRLVPGLAHDLAVGGLVGREASVTKPARREWPPYASG
jgi:hypothetical protein